MNEAHPHSEKVTAPCDDAWAGTIELDLRYFAEWVAYGLDKMSAMLGNQARFDAWIVENGR